MPEATWLTHMVQLAITMNHGHRRDDVLMVAVYYNNINGKPNTSQKTYIPVLLEGRVCHGQFPINGFFTIKGENIEQILFSTIQIYIIFDVKKFGASYCPPNKNHMQP